MIPTTISKIQAFSKPILRSNPSPYRGILVNSVRPKRDGPVHHRTHISAAAAAAAAALSFRGRLTIFEICKRGRGSDPMAWGWRGGGSSALLMVVMVVVASSLSSSSSSSSSSAVEALVKEAVSSHEIVIFSKSYCPYCKRAKSVFKELEKVPYVVELDEREDGHAIQEALGEIVGRHTVPQVFINGKHIGGSDDTVEAYANGTLAELLGIESGDDL